MYTFTYQKNIASCASLLVFKIAQSLQCICKEKASFSICQQEIGNFSFVRLPERHL